jgi:hypothetical protein
MSKFKFRGFIPAVQNYVKSKPVHEVIMEIFAFGFLAPLAITGIVFMAYQVIFNGVTI